MLLAFTLAFSNVAYLDTPMVTYAAEETPDDTSSEKEETAAEDTSEDESDTEQEEAVTEESSDSQETTEEPTVEEEPEQPSVEEEPTEPVEGNPEETLPDTEIVEEPTEEDPDEVIEEEVPEEEDEKPATYEVTFKASGDNGTVKVRMPDSEESEKIDLNKGFSGTVEEDSTVTFSVQADEGYSIDKVEVNKERKYADSQDGDVYTYELENIDSEKNVKIFFVEEEPDEEVEEEPTEGEEDPELESYELTVNVPEANGTVTVTTPEAKKADASKGYSAIVEEGSEVSLTVAPDEGYEIDSVSVNGKDAEASTETEDSSTYEIAEIKEDTEVTVTFEEKEAEEDPALEEELNEYEVTVDVLEDKGAVEVTTSEGKTVDASEGYSETVKEGSTISLEVEPEKGYKGVVKVNGKTVKATSKSLKSAVYAVKEITSDIAIEVSFVEEADLSLMPKQELTAEAGGVTVTVKAEAGVLPEGTKVVAKEVSSSKVEDAIAETMEEDKEIVSTTAIDVTLQDQDGNEVQPAEGRNVVVEFSGISTDGEADSMAVYHVDDAGESADKVTGDRAVSDSVVFTAGHFSIYVITETAKLYDGGESGSIEIEWSTLKHVPCYDISNNELIGWINVKCDDQNGLGNIKFNNEYTQLEKATVTKTTNTSQTVYDVTSIKYSFPDFIVNGESQSSDYLNSLKLYFRCTAKTATVSFDLNEGSGTKPEDIKATVGSEISLPSGDDLTREGYKFLGWCANKNSSVISDNVKPTIQDGTYVVSGSIKFYAAWAATTSTTGTIVTAIRADGETPYEPSLQYAEYKYFDELNNVELSQYFTPIHTVAGVDAVNNALTDYFKRSVEQWNETKHFWNPETQYVQWYVIKEQKSGKGSVWHIDGTVKDKSKFSLTYEPNCTNYTGEYPGGREYKENDEVTVEKGTLSRMGYDFLGWNTEKNGSGKPYQEGDIITMTQNITLWAQWGDANEFTITYELDGGSLAEGEANPKTYTVETETFTLKNPTKNGYTFKGWTGTELTEATKRVTVKQGSTGDRQYTATWEKDDSQKHSIKAQVEYYFGDDLEAAKAKTEADATEEFGQEGWIGEDTTVSVIIRDKSNDFKGYRYEATDGALSYTVNANAADDTEKHVVKVYYIPDENQTKKMSYQVNYYKDGTLEESSDLQELEVQVLSTATLQVNSDLINTTDKYEGFAFEKSEPAQIPTEVDQENVEINIYYATDNIDKDNPDTPGSDNIPDKYQAKVIYKIEHGTWDGNTDKAPKAYVYTWGEQDSNGNWSNGGNNIEWRKDIPTGMKGDTGYSKAKEWTPEIKGTTALIAGKTIEFVYIFEPDSHKITVKYESDTGESLKGSVITEDVKYDSDYDVSGQLGKDGEKIVIGDNTYIWEKNVGEPSGKVNGDIEITVQYTLDNIGEGDDPSQPDNIPDKYQVTVNFVVINGTWTAGSVTSRVLTLKNADGNWSKDGSATLTDDMIPGSRANRGYENGKWIDNNPKGFEIKKSMTFTIRYSAIPDDPTPTDPDPTPTPDDPDPTPTPTPTPVPPTPTPEPTPEPAPAPTPAPAPAPAPAPVAAAPAAPVVAVPDAGVPLADIDLGEEEEGEEPVGIEQVVNIDEEEVPLANEDLHDCCIFHFLEMLLALILLAWYTHDSKKRQQKIFELREQLGTEQTKRGISPRNYSAR